MQRPPRAPARAGSGSDRGCLADRGRSCFLPSCSGSAEQDVSQHDRLVAVLVLRRIDECLGTLAGETAQIAQHFAMAFESGTVPAAKLGPALGVVSEPLAKLGAWRDVLEPFVEPGFHLADPAGP